MTEALLTIALLHWVVLVTPGVNFLLLAQLSASGSQRTAVAAVMGITTATFVWAMLAVAGVGAIFAAHPLVRQLAQVSGGLYLLYLALRLWRSSGVALTGQARSVPRGAAFRLGLFTNMLNPKPALFFGSVFVTALPASTGAAGIAAAVVLVYLNSLVWHFFLVLMFSTPIVKRAYERVARTFNRVAGVLVGAFGIKLLWGTLQELRGKTSV